MQCSANCLVFFFFKHFIQASVAHLGQLNRLLPQNSNNFIFSQMAREAYSRWSSLGPPPSMQVRLQNIEVQTNIWSSDRNTLHDDEAKAQKLISVKCVHFNLKCMKCDHFNSKGAHFTQNVRISLWNAQNCWFPLKFVSNLGIGDWRLSRKTYEICAFQLEMRAFWKTLTRYGNSLVSLLTFCPCYVMLWYWVLRQALGRFGIRK